MMPMPPGRRHCGPTPTAAAVRRHQTACPHTNRFEEIGKIECIDLPRTVHRQFSSLLLDLAQERHCQI
jgi:hypothetical protein